jgi:hypothetical protein
VFLDQFIQKDLAEKRQGAQKEKKAAEGLPRNVRKTICPPDWHKMEKK